jgi:hypothetical protein
MTDVREIFFSAMFSYYPPRRDLETVNRENFVLATAFVLICLRIEGTLGGSATTSD